MSSLDMSGAVLSVGFGVKWQGSYLADVSRHRGCAAGCSRVWGGRGDARIFGSREEAEAVRDAEGLLPPCYAGVSVVELFEEVR